MSNRIMSNAVSTSDSTVDDGTGSFLHSQRCEYLQVATVAVRQLPLDKSHSGANSSLPREDLVIILIAASIGSSINRY